VRTCGLGPADSGAGAGVHFFDVSRGLHQAKPLSIEKVPMRLAMKFGGVLWARNDAFAELGSQKSETTQNSGEVFGRKISTSFM